MDIVLLVVGAVALTFVAALIPGYIFGDQDSFFARVFTPADVKGRIAVAADRDTRPDVLAAMGETETDARVLHELVNNPSLPDECVRPLARKYVDAYMTTPQRCRFGVSVMPSDAAKVRRVLECPPTRDATEANEAIDVARILSPNMSVQSLFAVAGSPYHNITTRLARMAVYDLDVNLTLACLNRVSMKRWCYSFAKDHPDPRVRLWAVGQAPLETDLVKFARDPDPGVAAAARSRVDWARYASPNDPIWDVIRADALAQKARTAGQVSDVQDVTERDMPTLNGI